MNSSYPHTWTIHETAWHANETNPWSVLENIKCHVHFMNIPWNHFELFFQTFHGHVSLNCVGLSAGHEKFMNTS